MATKALVIDAGTTKRVPDAETLVVGAGIDAATATTLTIGGTTATSITLGSATIPVNIPGDVTTVGGTTFTTDATFEGNVTFGAGAADTVTFAALTTVTSNINFGGAPGTYKITNLANGTNPNDAVNFSQLSAIVSGVSAVTASAPLASSGGATPDISLTGIVGVANGGTGTGTAFTQGSVVFAGAAGVYAQDNANLFWDDTNDRLGVGVIPSALTNPERLNVSGRLALAEGTAPSAESGYGKLYALSSDSRPYFMDDSGQAFNLTLDRFNTLTPAASVAIDANPALPVFNSLSLNQNTTFTTTNLGNGRSASVRVVCDGTTRTLTFPGGWTWLGSGPPSSLAANDVGYLSITAYGATDADVVAAWSYENQPVAVTGSGVDNQIAVWSGTNTQDGSAALTFNGTTLGVTGGITQTGGAVSLTGNAASSLTTSSGALTLTSAAAATWSSTAGNLAITGGAALQLAAAAGNEVVVNDGSADVDFRVESNGLTHAIFVDAGNDRVGVSASNLTHTFNVGDGTNSNFCVASGGRIHTYDGTAPTNGQVLIGDTALGNFAKAVLTAGSGVSITNGAGSITIAATGSGGTVTSVDVSGGTTGLTTSGGPIVGSGTITLAGTLNVANGGTGATSITAGSLVVGDGTNAIDEIAPGTNGQVLTVVGGAWAAASLPAATDYSVITLTTAEAANTAVTVAGAAAIATAASTSRVAGIVTATNTVKILGICTCDVEGSLSIAAGDVVYLSASEAGAVTNVAPSTATQVVAELGIATAASSGGAVAVLWQPKSIVVL